MPSINVQNVTLSYPVFRHGHGGVHTQGSGASQHAGALTISRDRGAEIKALDSVTMSLSSGDRLALVGRNGSGKSTLLRVLAGIYAPTNGTILVSGRVATLFSVGLGVHRDATGRRNAILRGLMHGLTHREAESKSDEIIAFAELGPYIDMPVRTYSSGMAMRLSFAMATAFSPEVLLLDEWIGAGDERFQAKAAARMHDLVSASGITVIASHRRTLIKQVCNVAIWLEGGIQRAFGPVDEVFEQMDSAYGEV